MPSPPITVYLTTIASQPALRQRQEYLLRVLQSKRIPFNSYDLASDEEAKRLWKRRAPLDKQQLPGILVGSQFVGTFQEFEEAVEYNELTTFLRLNESWDEGSERPPPPVKPVGVPGASLPMEMTPEHIRTKILAQQQSSPLKRKVPPKPVNREDGSEIDIGEDLAGYGLQGVKVTEDELRDLLEELGLGGDEAGDLVKGLIDTPKKDTSKDAKKKDEEKKDGGKKDEAKKDEGKKDEGKGEEEKGEEENLKDVAKKDEEKKENVKGKAGETPKTSEATQEVKAEKA